ncbi:hypothetical protein SLEP1_g37470 [Rubroshorea leprosula]|uniref:BED-type domain-containing protein n=1 Tax=Rubroshorea leprosula TaxID=152421 RepID=A0AAV5KUR3_9ROSI|nr:hypothetical protein SLEP1_g37470 [Rubroshorea leprosula]
MGSQFAPVPIKSRKQDPAWKHCHMLKDGEKVQLKCVYCSKVFRGGGIHRIKEHLATLKSGNASPCSSVPPDVCDQMQKSLDGITPKRRKTQKVGEEIMRISGGAETQKIGEEIMRIAGEAETLAIEGDANTGLHMFGAMDPLEPCSASGLLVNREVSSSAARDKRKRGRKSSANTNALAFNTSGLGADADAAATLNTTGLDEDVVAPNTTGLGAKRVNNHLNMAIGRFLFDVGAPLDAVNSVYFQPMFDAIVSVGSESLLPSQNDIRGWVLKNSVEEVKADVNKIAAAWGKTGCSVLVDQQKTETKVQLNFLVNCPEGMVFLKSVDASGFSSSSDALYELLKQLVEEVGLNNIMQVITNNDELCIAAARRLADTFPSLYWTPCAVCCLDMILRDFSKIGSINAIIEQARSITRFMYNHSEVLNMVRRYTFGIDVIEPAVTHSATNFTTLKRIVDLKQNLQSVVTSQEWVDSPYSKKPGGLEMLDIVSNQSFWSTCDRITQLTNPLLRVLRIVGSKKRPAMGYVYAGMYRAKETIKKELVKREEYMIYWDIIDHYWRQQWQHPLHAAGFYLNPKFFYSFEGDMPKEIHSGMLDCIERLVPDIRMQDKIVKELHSYKNAVGDFGRNMAIRARETLLPAEWWSTYGGSCPNLARLAIRILSQTCSSRGFNRNHICFEQLHDVRNCLEHQRLRDLIFVQYNLRLKQIRGSEDKEQNYVDPISVDTVSVVEDWVREDICFEDYSNSDWMALDQLSLNTMFLGLPVDEVDELGAGFGDEEIFDRLDE